MTKTFENWLRFNKSVNKTTELQRAPSLVDSYVQLRISKHGCDFRFARIFENYFIRAIEHVFRVYIASSKHSECWKNSRKLLSTTSRVCITLSNFPNHPYVQMRLCKHGKCQSEFHPFLPFTPRGARARPHRGRGKKQMKFRLGKCALLFKTKPSWKENGIEKDDQCSSRMFESRVIGSLRMIFNQ